MPLTSVRQPARTMGTLAAQMLLQETDAHAGDRHQHVVLQQEVVVRKSSLA